MDRTHRLGTIIKLIGNHPGITLSKLRDKLSDCGVEITERTLAKDILILKSEFGLLPMEERLRRGYVLQDMVTLSEAELGLVIDAMHVFGVRLSDPEAQQMLERLNTHNAKPIVRSRTIGHRNIYKKANTSNIDSTLLTAIRERRGIKYGYDTPRVGKEQNFAGYPLLLIFHERGWYCIVRDLNKNHYHPRRVDRIRSCSLTDAPANSQHLENLKEAQFLIGCGWGMCFPRSTTELEQTDAEPEIVVRFARTIAGYILEAAERHPRARIRRCKDGSGDVEFRIQLSNPAEFMFWVRSFGAQAWVTGPQSLLERERTEIRRMAAVYGILDG